MAEEPRDTVMPTVKIPAQPEITMAGITQILTPTIMKCAMGGWLVIMPDRGVAGKSELREAIAFIEEQAFDIFNEQPESMPSFMDRPADPPEEMRQSYSEILRRRSSEVVNAILAAFIAFPSTIATLLGVKALGT